MMKRGLSYERLPDIIKAIEGITYKKGWSLEVVSSVQDVVRTDLIEVAVIHQTIDSTDGDTPARLKRNSIYFPVNWYEPDVIKRVYEEFLRCEIHECQEFFKYNGKLLFNPHPKVDTFNRELFPQSETDTFRKVVDTDVGHSVGPSVDHPDKKLTLGPHNYGTANVDDISGRPAMLLQVTNDPKY